MTQTPEEPPGGAPQGAPTTSALNRGIAGGSGLTCDAVQSHFVDASTVEDGAIEAHRASCHTCTSLFGAGLPLLSQAPLAPTDGSLGGARDALMAQVSRPATWRERLVESPLGLRLGLLVVLAIGALAIAVGRLRADFWAYPGLRMALVLAALVAAGLLGVTLCLRPLWKPPSLWLALGPWLLAALPMGLAALPAAVTGHPESLLGAGSSATDRAVSCLVYGTVLALPLLVGWRLLDRAEGREPTRSRVAAVGAAGFANAALQLHCPLTDSSHLLFGHAAVVLSCWLVARWALRFPFSRPAR